MLRANTRHDVCRERKSRKRQIVARAKDDRRSPLMAAAPSLSKLGSEYSNVEDGLCASPAVADYFA
jgi:hypothetical protein